MSASSPWLPVAAVVAALALAPLGFTSNVVLNFLAFVMIITLAAQGWNLLAGYGGQFSFGHAAFFGTGPMSWRSRRCASA